MIGRAKERTQADLTIYHELSYQLLRQWFKEDRKFDLLSRSEKLNYSTRFVIIGTAPRVNMIQRDTATRIN